LILSALCIGVVATSEDEERIEELEAQVAELVAMLEDAPEFGPMAFREKDFGEPYWDQYLEWKKSAWNLTKTVKEVI
jgi:hypothetical protein